MVDVTCSRNSTAIVTEDNEIFHWGINQFAQEGWFSIPVMVNKPDELVPEISHQMVDKLAGLKGLGYLISSKPRVEMDDSRDSHDQSFAHSMAGRDNSTMLSEKQSFTAS